MDFDFWKAPTAVACFELAMFCGVDRSGEEWNDRTTDEGLVNCLSAEATANGLLTTNDMVATMLDGLTWTKGRRLNVVAGSDNDDALGALKGRPP